VPREGGGKGGGHPFALLLAGRGRNLRGLLLHRSWAEVNCVELFTGEEKNHSFTTLGRKTRLENRRASRPAEGRRGMGDGINDEYVEGGKGGEREEKDSYVG